MSGVAVVAPGASQLGRAQKKGRLSQSPRSGEPREPLARRVDADWRAGEIKSHPLVACGTVDRVVRFTDAKPQSHPDIAGELRPTCRARLVNLYVAALFHSSTPVGF